MLTLLGATPIVRDSPPRADAPLARLAFLRGRWVHDSAGVYSEETWSDVRSEHMIGMWRLIARDTVRVLELLSLTSEAGGVTLRVRHFDGASNAWEAAEAPETLRLLASRDRAAIFVLRSPARYLRIRYELVGPVLESEVLDGSSEATAARQLFRFRRASR